MSSIQAIPTFPASKDAQAVWALNTATSCPSASATPPASQGSQWTLISCNNMNASMLLNANGSITILQKGTYLFILSSISWQNAVVTNTSGVTPPGVFASWFIYQPSSSSTTYAPRLGWTQNGYITSSLNNGTYTFAPPTLSSTASIPCNVGDVITPYVFQNAASALSLFGGSGFSPAGSSGAFSSVPVIMSCSFQHAN